MAEDYVAPNRHLCNGRVGKVTGVCPSKLRWRFRDYKYRVSVEFEFGITLYLLAELNELGEPPDFSSALTQLECSVRQRQRWSLWVRTKKACDSDSGARIFNPSRSTP